MDISMKSNETAISVTRIFSNHVRTTPVGLGIRFVARSRKRARLIYDICNIIKGFVTLNYRCSSHMTMIFRVKLVRWLLYSNSNSKGLFCLSPVVFIGVPVHCLSTSGLFRKSYVSWKSGVHTLI